MSSSLAALTAASALLGLVIGSFVNVVASRLPAGRSVVAPGSACPVCGSPIAARDNVPVLSWLLLRGRCRACRAPISPRYPLVELLTAGVFAVVALRIGWHPDLAAFLVLAASGMALALIDLDTHRLPNALTLPAYPVGLALLGIAALAARDGGPLLRGLAGMLSLLALYALLFVLHPRGMGLGDVKLAGVLGLHLGWLGWAELAVGAWLGFLAGGAVGIVLLALGRAGRKTPIPFGPYMLLGALGGILWGDAIAAAYLTW
jgi:leader peptidase (prepilin peptidase)/N-methyltransferase